MTTIKLASIFFITILFFNCKEQKIVKTTSKYTYNKGLLVTHWTGAVAPRYKGQSNIEHTYGASWFDEEDVEWIANHGFDHLQIDVDENQWFSEDEKENKKNIATYRKAIEWAHNYELGVVLVFDVFPYGEQPSSMDEAVLNIRASQWKQISEYFLEIKEGLRFHSGNREISLVSNPNKRYQEYYKAIREVDKNRFFYIPVPIDVDTTKVTEPYMYSPKGFFFEHISALNLDEYDENVGVSFTYFQPEVFIYQKPGQEFPVLFPGKVPNFKDANIDSTYYNGYSKMAKAMSNKTIGAKDIDLDFKNIVSQMKVIVKNRDVYLGRFGLHYGLDSISSVNYMRAIKNAAEKNNMSWCVYDYESGRAIRNSDENPNVAYYGLDLKKK